MLVDYRPSWARTLAQIGKPLAGACLLACLVTGIHFLHFQFLAFAIPDLPLSMFGSALALLLGFRTNSAYARWWEARTLWGGIVNQSRTWARQSLAYPDVPGFASAAIHLQIDYVNALRLHLRAEQPNPKPLELLQAMSTHVTGLFRAGHVGELRFLGLQTTLTELTNLQGGCERIRNTPLPRQYDFWPETFVYLYCFLLPFAIVNELSWLTPLVTLIVAFVFLVLNRIGRNLEDPFHSAVYGTPMTALCRTIENDLRALLGEPALPPHQPSGGVLD